MINLTEEDKDLIRHIGFPKSNKLSMGNFYIKLVSKAEALKELLGDKIARDIFQLKCPREYACMVDNDYYILSEDLNLEGKFVTAKHLGVQKDMSLYDIWTLLETEETQSRENIRDVIKIYMFDVMLHNLDRHEDNWGLLYLPDNSKKVVILDYDLILSNKLGAKENENDFLEMHTDLDNSLSLYDDFKRFLLESDVEFIKMFKSYFDVITPDYFRGLIEKLARENNISVIPEYDFVPSLIDTLSNTYSSHYEMLKEIYESVIERRDSVAR